MNELLWDATYFVPQSRFLAAATAETTFVI